jgi:membrane glycosyltransferase
MLLAPIRMLFHTQFVIATLAGWHAAWKSPPRSDEATSWHEAMQRHGWHTALGVVWAALIYWIDAAYLLWLLPIIVPLLLAIPLSVWSSRTAVGQRFRNAGLFVIPEEAKPPPELRDLRQRLSPAAAARGFRSALVDPLVNAVLRTAACVRKRPRGLARAAQRARIAAALNGPRGFDDGQKLQLLDDAAALDEVHAGVWRSNAAYLRWRPRGAGE